MFRILGQYNSSLDEEFVITIETVFDNENLFIIEIIHIFHLFSQFPSNILILFTTISERGKGENGL